MRLLVSEFVCSGGWPAESLSPTLRQEGRAMLLAILRDALRIEGLQPVTIWDERHEPFPLSGVEFHSANSVEKEIQLLADLAAECDGTLLIAPEFDGLLTHRALLVEGVGGRSCGSNPAAIVNCADKLATCELLTEVGIPSIPTSSFVVGETTADQISFPAVVKPVDGAGSQDTYIVQDASEFARFQPEWKRSSLLKKAIWQPYIVGRAVSVGVLVRAGSDSIEALLPCEQTLSQDGRLRYLGGVLPALGAGVDKLQSLAIQACLAIPGLKGYVGIDLVIPADDPEKPFIVEINPRVTTSYLGYSQLCQHNLLARWLGMETEPGPLVWKPGSITFSPLGEEAGQD